ncbi:hypothetical protein [Bdellovibrio sp. HCB2-146]|uniref:hypothetical protein n=1 Tax=Bdellovibrio sp. HCB2-146 TaxID=3394362 RepID=UPI0039BCB5E3
MKSAFFVTVACLVCLSAFAGNVEIQGEGLMDLVTNEKLGSLIAVHDLQFEHLAADCTAEEMKSAASTSVLGCQKSNIDAIGIESVGFDQVRLSLEYGRTQAGEMIQEGYMVTVGATCQVEEFVETSLSGFVKYVFTSEIAMSKKLVCRIRENGSGTVEFKILE